jgi:hypothetical protein
MFFAKGGCAAGDACQYLHEPSEKPKSVQRAAPPVLVAKPTTGVAVHAKNAWGRGKPALRSDGEDVEDNKYGTESFTIGGDADPASTEDTTEAGAGPGSSYAGKQDSILALPWASSSTHVTPRTSITHTVPFLAGLARSGLDTAAIDATAVRESDWVGEGHSAEAQAQVLASREPECARVAGARTACADVALRAPAARAAFCTHRRIARARVRGLHGEGFSSPRRLSASCAASRSGSCHRSPHRRGGTAASGRSHAAALTPVR